MQNREISSKHLASFTGFILPFLGYSLVRDESFQFDEQEKKFIKSYIIAGYYFWGLLILTIVIGVLKYFWLYQVSVVSSIVKVLFFILNVLVLVYLFVVVFLIFSNKEINFKEFSLNISYSDINLDVVYFYLPGYNFWLWYKYYNRVKTIFYLKESILLWFLVMIFYTNFVSEIILIFIVLRAILLSFGVDFIKEKKYLDKLFTINPEEIFAWIIGYVKYFIFKILGKKSIVVESIISNTKKDYEQLIDFNDLLKSKSKMLKLQIFFQYVVLMLVFFYFIFEFFKYLPYRYGLDIGFSILCYFLFIVRYSVLFWFRKIIRIPILNEISKILFVVINS